jgi:hypothetical protein
MGSSAVAATVEVLGSTATIRAPLGERNEIETPISDDDVLSVDGVDAYRFTDVGAGVLVAGANCVQEAAASVICRIPFPPELSVDLGDRADQLNQGQEPSRPLASSRGPFQRTRIIGGPGDDNLGGTYGFDLMLGRGGDDELVTELGDDAGFGGSGGDQLLGDRGLDRLAGGRGSDRLFGGQTSDRLLGGAGTDLLFGGDETDTCFGGPSPSNAPDLAQAGCEEVFSAERFSGPFEGHSAPSPSVVSATPSGADPMHSPVRIDARSGENEINVQWGSGQITVSDVAGALAGERCQAEDDNVVSCQTTSTHISALLGAGADAITISTPLRLTAYGFSGADRITGSAEPDRVYGDPGSDRIATLAGDDHLEGGIGRDALSGGRGDDALRAQNGDVDMLIDCGRGHDRARIDRSIDPKPERCEYVRRG